MRALLLASTMIPLLALSSVASARERGDQSASAKHCTITVGSAIPDVCTREFDKWFDAEREWREWMDLHFNQFTSGDEPARKRPQPPSWLVTFCEGTDEIDLKNPGFCPRYNALKDYNAANREKNLNTLVQLHGEKTKKSSWLQFIHLDGPWSASQWPSSAYGVVGIHAAMEIEGRFSLFIAPGVLLFTLRNTGVQQGWEPAWDYGGGIRLFDFKMPGTSRTMRLHFNFAKAWALDGSIQGLDVMGFSVTFKPREQRPAAPTGP